MTQASVSKFVLEQKECLSHLKGFQSLIKDMSGMSGDKRAKIDNDTLGKKILGHYYDSIVEQPIAKAFKLFAIKEEAVDGSKTVTP